MCIRDSRRRWCEHLDIRVPVAALGYRPTGNRDVQKIQTAEMKFLRGTQGCSFLDQRRNEDIRRDLNTVSEDLRAQKEMV